MATLNDEERVAWIRLALVAQAMPAALDSHLIRESGITHIEYLVMVLLAQADDRSLPMSRVAALSGSSLSRLSHVATRLEKDGYLVRRRSETDARVIIATVTDAGVAVVRAASGGHLQNVRNLVFDRLTKQQVAQLSEIMRILLAELDPTEELSSAAK